MAGQGHPPLTTLLVKAVPADVPSVVVQTSPGSPRSPGVAQEPPQEGLLPRHEQQQPQAQSQPPAKSWAQHRCPLGEWPAALLGDAPFPHLLHLLLGTPTPVLREENSVRPFPFSPIFGTWLLGDP